MKHFSQAETMQHQLSEFHTTFGHPQDVPYLDDHILALRKRLVKEEANELLEALDEGDQEQVLKELCDLLYVTVGLADTYGWNLNVAFNRVHMSNMSKLDGDGNVVRDEGGKILKSENYQAPDLSDLVYGGKVPKMYLYKKSA
jgi:predicted HAD superfamily Cof-like phosphohydrolase|tara:strand:- start:335 stop:763 length:429 start_codon:yes stop_codon:yes gene_type:complete